MRARYAYVLGLSVFAVIGMALLWSDIVPAQTASKPLQKYRAQIDEIDASLVELLNSRAKVVQQIGKLKRSEESRQPIYAPAREQAVLDRVHRLNRGPLSDRALGAVFREIMSGSIALQGGARVGYLGPEGSFSQIAALRKFGSSIDYVAMSDVDEIVGAVQAGKADLGIVPIENAIDGWVDATLDALAETDVPIVAEALLPVQQNLLSRAPLARVRRVYSHPKALAQCRQWLKRNLPNARLVPTSSTSEAAKIAKNKPGSAAIASSLAAEHYDLPIVAKQIEDRPNNMTRFVIVGQRASRPSGDDITSLLFEAKEEPRMLTQVFDTLNGRGLRVFRLAERPARGRNWSYNYFVDLVGHASQSDMQSAIRTLRYKGLDPRWLGSYPRATEPL